jgi:hypothetical protein
LDSIASSAQFFAHAFIGYQCGHSVLARADGVAITERRTCPFTE